MNGSPVHASSGIQDTADDSDAANVADDVERPEYQQILALIEKGKVNDAAKLLDEYLQSHPHAHKFHLFRQALSNIYFRTSKRLLAEQQLLKFFRYQFEHPVRSRPLLKYAPRLIINLSSIQQGVEPEASEVLDGTLKLLRVAIAEEPRNSAYSNGLSSAIGLKARLWLQQSRSLDAMQLYQEEVSRLKTAWRENLENPDAWVRLTYFMKSAEQAIGSDESAVVYRWSWERWNLESEGLRRFPTSTRIVNEYFEDLLKNIREYEEVLPDKALEMYERANAEIIATLDKQLVRKTLYPLRLQIGKRWQALKRKLTRERLAGEPLPELGAIDWLKQPDGPLFDKTNEDLVLVFWSPAKQDELRQLIILNDILKTRFPQARLCLLAPKLGEAFERLPFVSFRNEITDEQQQQYRQHLLKSVIEANGFEFPIGIPNQLSELPERFGMEATPFGVVVRKGECLPPNWGSEMYTELISQLEN